MESLAALYKNHIVTLQERTRDVLARFQMDALLIHSGELVNVFLAVSYTHLTLPTNRVVCRSRWSPYH